MLMAGSMLAGIGCRTQQPPAEVSANIIIPDPPPRTPVSQWHDATGRSAVSAKLDSAALRGFRYQGRDVNAPTILFFNGNGMTADQADGLYRSIAALGPSVVVYDYRGYGFSSGQPDLMTFRQDGLSLYDQTANAAPNHRVVVYGFSMGTAIASYIATQRPVTALILAAPIASAEEEFPVFAKLMGYPPGQRPDANAGQVFGEAKMAAQTKAPLLVLHGNADELVPIEQGREVFAASAAPIKKFVMLPGVGHNSTADNPVSMRAVSEFLSKL